MSDLAPSSDRWQPITADDVADALEELIRRKPAELAGVLRTGLDRSELTRLYCVTEARLGYSIGFDPSRYCPWCRGHYTEDGFADHLEIHHAAMVYAK